MPEGSGMKKIVKLGFVLFVVTAVTGLILGVVNDITAEPIRVTQERMKQEALAGALPEAEEFLAEDLKDVSNPEQKAILKEVNAGRKGGDVVGYCITVAPRGYGGNIDIVVGVRESGGVRAIRILNQTETPGLGAKADAVLRGQFDNKEVDSLAVVKRQPSAANEIQAISGATITSNAVVFGVNTALDYWKNNLKGGE
jgi:electron transport complex protein RnfG